MKRYEFIKSQKAAFPVAVLCRVDGVSRSGFYAWQERPPSLRALANRVLARKITEIHAGSGATYGSPRIYLALKAAGESVSLGRVERVMRAGGIVARVGRRRVRTTIPTSGPWRVPDRVAQTFTAQAPDRLWVGDITYVRTWEGWLYLATVIDVFSRRIIGWAMAAHMRSELVEDALKMAVATRHGRVGGVIFHSDRGGQYGSHAYRRLCARYRIRRSAGRTGICWDNALAESVFASLKKEVIYRSSWPTKASARQAIFAWIEGWYNSRRIHSALGGSTPISYEQSHHHQAALAA